VQIKSLRCLAKPLQLQVKQFAEVTSLSVALIHTEWFFVAPYPMDKSRRGYSDLFIVAIPGFVVWGSTKKIMK
jgi:hypothetical protein